MSPERWDGLMTLFGASRSGDTYADFLAAYSEPHRHYHTTAHIDDCLAQLDQARAIAAAPHEIEIALWFHDAVYKPTSSKNEAESAGWAMQFLRSIGAPEDQQTRIFNYIMATKHDAEPGGGGATIVVDIDLSILGRQAQDYDLFEERIRREYKWVPGALYRRKRIEVLESFLKRRSIYGSQYFRELYESHARRNLERAIRALRR
jgi:predicted metal-dependent HD superfamily phosphohydrolase